MSGNSALSVLRADVRDLLNESTAAESFWSDAQLDKYINQAYIHYHQQWTGLKDDWGLEYTDFTYTGGSESVDVTITNGDPYRLRYVEDRTDTQPGVILPVADTRRNLHRRYWNTADEVAYGSAAGVFIDRTITKASGVFTVAFSVFMAPMPSGDRSIRLHYQLMPEKMAADTHTTGLPGVCETCIELKAAMFARLQEEAQVPGLQSMLMDAERTMRKAAKPLKRGPDRVRFNAQNVN